ncbi:MAG: SPOR domain-containing protein [Candidatus Omnitrophica bacterium]|nr:SPOR domain-containing protein [Candidatus Omnitrophota bacterium]
MEKQDQSQLELFSRPPQGGAPAGANGLSRSFINQIWRYEKGVLIAILLLVTGVIAFSAGFEKGRRKGLADNTPVQTPLPAEAPPEAARQKPTPLAPAAAQAPAPKPQAQGQPKQTGNYTIQVASFSTPAMARKEAEALKKKGHNTVIISGSKYTVLCVGRYQTKENAQQALSELKKHYRDCFIRRL